VAVAILLLVPMVEQDWAKFLPEVVLSYTGYVHQLGLAVVIVATLLAVSSGVSYARKYRHMFDDANK